MSTNPARPQEPASRQSATQRPKLSAVTRDLPTVGLLRHDRYDDTLLSLALIAISTYHMFGWSWLPMVFPAMGVMFALAGSATAGSLDRSPGNPWRVLKTRSIRLLPPVWLFALVAVPAMLLAGWTHNQNAGAPLSWHTLLFWVVPISDPPASQLGADWASPLWYIRSYLWFLVLSPATLWLFRHWPKRMIAIPVIAVLLSALGALQLSGRSGDVILSTAMFGGCWMLGFAHNDKKIRPVPLGKVLIGGTTLMALALVWASTHPDQASAYDIANIPMANTLYGVGATWILLRLHPRLSWMDKAVFLDKLNAVITSRAMTIYLWGNLAIFLANLVIDRFPATTSRIRPDVLGHLQMSVTWWLILTCFVLAFGWCEDLAAGRQPKLNPWPRDKHQLDALRTRKLLTFARPTLMAHVTPRRLFIVTSLLLVAAATASAAALAGTNTPSRTATGDTPSRYAVNPRPDTKPPANLGQGNGQPADIQPTSTARPDQSSWMRRPVGPDTPTVAGPKAATRPARPIVQVRKPKVPTPAAKPPATKASRPEQGAGRPTPKAVRPAVRASGPTPSTARPSTRADGPAPLAERPPIKVTRPEPRFSRPPIRPDTAPRQRTDLTAEPD